MLTYTTYLLTDYTNYLTYTLTDYTDLTTLCVNDYKTENSDTHYVLADWHYQLTLHNTYIIKTQTTYWLTNIHDPIYILAD